MQHIFIKNIPEILDDNILYISLEYSVAIHKCPSGCGLKVVTPISPSGWKLTYDGESVSLSPSVGNWSFPCKSHYWISEGEVRWSYLLTKKEIDRVRKRDAKDVDQYFSKRKNK